MAAKASFDLIIIGPRAAAMIAECVLALEFGASSEDIARTVHGHPSSSPGQAGSHDVKKTPKQWGIYLPNRHSSLYW